MILHFSVYSTDFRLMNQDFLTILQVLDSSLHSNKVAFRSDIFCPGRLKCAPTGVTWSSFSLIFFQSILKFSTSFTNELLFAVIFFACNGVYNMFRITIYFTSQLSSTLNFAAELSTIQCSEISGQQLAFLHFFIPTIILRSRVDSGSLVFTSRFRRELFLVRLNAIIGGEGKTSFK